MAKGGKKNRASKADKKRRGRNTGLYILGGLALLFVLYLIDRSGPLETVDGFCVDTSRYNHSGTDGGTHTHVEAIVEYEGHRYSVRPGDQFAVGDPVAIEVHRGHFTGYPYFNQAYRRP